PEIVVCPTSREPSGLARSSRNALLSDADRDTFAAVIYQALTDAKHAWREGERNPARLRELMHSKLNAPGVKIEYADLRDPLAWSADSPQRPMERAQALIAVDIGGVRLIDNLRLDEQDKGPAYECGQGGRRRVLRLGRVTHRLQRPFLNFEF
ncbi:MAG: pantoate--beta-alanine ligase, partial [Pseudomonadota bacterium]|nr:pantoate--beta-alanine ligase [Pseudomonadota bacterium]